MAYNLPALNWLAKKNPDAALAVFHRLRDESCNFGAESNPGDLDPRDRSSDDMETHVVPDEPVISETMAEPVQDGPDEVWPEMLHEVKPDIHGMLRSAGGVALPWSGVRWRNRRSGKVRWIGEPWAYLWCCLPHTPERHVVTTGGLTFYTRPEARRGLQGGMLVSYIDDSGEVQRPAYKASKPRGGKRPFRENPQGYLNLPAAIPCPFTVEGIRTPMSGEPALMPMLNPLGRRAPDASLDICGQIDADGRFGVVEGRALLQSLGVDGAVPFEELPFPATRCSSAIAKGAQFVGGISGRSQTASSGTIGRVQEPVKVEARVAVVLDEVAARGTLESIGIRLGYRGGYADRAGGKALLAAGVALIAANDDSRKRVAA